MDKIAFVGMERSGKTTALRYVASKLSSDHNIDSHILPEIINQPGNFMLNIDLPSVQRYFMLEQIAQEGLITTLNDRQLLFVDRTPLDTLVYYSEVETYTPYENTMCNLVRDWMYTYRYIFVMQKPKIEMKVNSHIRQKDVEAREARAMELDVLLHKYTHKSVVSNGDEALQILFDKHII